MVTLGAAPDPYLMLLLLRRRRQQLRAAPTSLDCLLESHGRPRPVRVGMKCFPWCCLGGGVDSEVGPGVAGLRVVRVVKGRWNVSGVSGVRFVCGRRARVGKGWDARRCARHALLNPCAMRLCTRGRCLPFWCDG